MPSLGELFVTIGAKTGPLDKGAKDSEKTLNKLQDSMRSTIRTGALLAAGAAAAGGALIVNLVNSGRLAIDSQAKLAVAINGTIGGLRAVEMAAGDAGVSSEELSGALVRMNARLGEAQRGSGAAFDSLERLGLSAEYLSSLDIDTRMAVLADRMSELGLSSSAAAAEMRDLGIRNENLVTLMRQGGDAIRAQSQEVRDLGLNLSMVDAAQVEAANDALGVFGDVITGIKDRLAVTSAPYITELSERFRQVALDSGGFKNEIEATINTIIRGFGKAADVIHGLRVVFKGVEVVARGFGAAVLTALELATGAVQKLTNDAISGTRRLGEIMRHIPGVGQAIGGALAEIGDISFDAVSDSAEGMRQGLFAATQELQAMAMQELPSTQIEKFLADVAAKSLETAQQVVAARNQILGNNPSEVGGLNDADQKELEALKEKYMTQEELERQHRETMAIIGEEFDAGRFESERQWMDVREQAQQEHWSRLQELANGGYKGIQALAHKAWGRVGAETAGAFQSILGTMAQGSRKAFEISKAWAIADALISTFQGIAAGVKLGWPMAIPAVAWAAASGFAQVSNIRAQSFNGGGGSAASAPTSAAPAAAAPSSGGGGGGGDSGPVVTLAGLRPDQLYDGRHMISVLNEAIENGARLRVA